MPARQNPAPRPVLSEEERDLRWSTRSRCLAVLAELEAHQPCWDSIQTLLEGGAEDIEAAT